MARDINTTEIFRGVAQRAARTDKLFGREQPSPLTFLTDLQQQVLDENATTGDDMIDYLVACYGDCLEDSTIKRFDRLDRKVSEAVGQTALLVHRERGRRSDGLNSYGSYAVRATYYVGQLGEGGLQFDLHRGTCVLPTESYQTVSTIPFGDKKELNGGIVVNQVFDPHSDDGLASIGAIGKYIDLCYDPDRVYAAGAEYITPEARTEIEKGVMQLILGTENVSRWIADDSLASDCFNSAV